MDQAIIQIFFLLDYDKVSSKHFSHLQINSIQSKKCMWLSIGVRQNLVIVDLIFLAKEHLLNK